MSKNARFEEFILGDGYPIARHEQYPEYYAHPITQARCHTWQAAIQSLEVTAELVEVGFEATHERSKTTRRDILFALTAVFNAIKEQAK